MNARQFDALRALVKHYAYNLPDDLTERRMDQIKKAEAMSASPGPAASNRATRTITAYRSPCRTIIGVPSPITCAGYISSSLGSLEDCA